MTDYKQVLCYQTPKDEDQEEDSSTEHSSTHSKSFSTTSKDYHDWLFQQMKDYHNKLKRDRSGKQSFYTKKQVEILDLVEADVIDFLYEIRQEFDCHYNLADFLDGIVFPNMSSIRVDDVDEEEDHASFDE